MLHSDNSQLNEDPLTFSLKKEDTEFLFSIPKDYFLGFPELVLQEVHAIAAEEITKNWPKTNPFELKSNYFNQLSEEYLEIIKIDAKIEQPLTTQLTKEIPFDIPEDYFATMEADLFDKLNIGLNEEEDWVELSPLLASLKGKQTFELPEDFNFKPQEKTIALKPKTAQRSIKWMRWAAAAMVIAIFSLGGWQFLLESPLNTNNNYAMVQEGINQISDAEIKEYLNASLNDYEVTMLAQNMDWSASPFDGISNEELKNYLEEGAY